MFFFPSHTHSVSHMFQRRNLASNQKHVELSLVQGEKNVKEKEKLKKMCLLVEREKGN